MKFRCRMVDAGAMRDFTCVVNTISRIAKYCVLRLTQDELCFNLGDERAPVLWAMLSQEHFFTEYIMIGVCENENEICLEFDALMFARSLNSLKAMARSVKIKLTNKQQPCLTFEIDLSSAAIETRQCVHDVPVRLVSRKEWQEYRMPVISEFDVSLEISQLKYLRHIVDRMKSMSTKVTVIADKHGTLMLRVEADHATVTTHFRGLQVQMTQQEEQDEEDSDITATINVKKLAIFLGWDILQPDSVKCNILREKMVKLTMNVADHIQLHYFEPAIAS